MALETNTDVTEIDTVVDDQGDLRSPANLTLQQEIRDTIQNVQNAVSNYASLGGFTYTTSSTSAEALDATDVPRGATVLLHADPDNTGRVYVGSDTDQPVSMSPDGTMTVDVEDTSAIYVRTPNSGDSVGVLFEDA